ncbi:MAG: S1-like domain-containing RNA-binding protein, partial [Myxococcota bacterium]
MKHPLSHERWLGRTVDSIIHHFGPPGAFLCGPNGDVEARGPTVLLPYAEVPPGAKPGDALQAFVHLDTEGRPIATMKQPKIELGEVAFLDVTDATDFGAFVDWGLGKELFVPFAEQTSKLSVGNRHPIGLYVDDSGR